MTESAEFVLRVCCNLFLYMTGSAVICCIYDRVCCNLFLYMTGSAVICCIYDRVCCNLFLYMTGSAVICFHVTFCVFVFVQDQSLGYPIRSRALWVVEVRDLWWENGAWWEGGHTGVLCVWNRILIKENIFLFILSARPGGC